MALVHLQKINFLSSIKITIDHNRMNFGQELHAFPSNLNFKHVTHSSKILNLVFCTFIWQN